MTSTFRIKNGTNVSCFVPYCPNKKNFCGNPIHFFQVPPGNEGLLWKKAVNYNESQNKKRIGILRLQVSPSTIYCCEIHFNIETDSNWAINDDGSVKCDIKSGILPNIKPTRSKRLWEVLEKKCIERFEDVAHAGGDDNLLQPIENQFIVNAVPQSSDFISIVDMSTLICTNLNGARSHDQTNDLDHQIEIKFKPIMPLTMELMKRKSFYYMGLEQNLFLSLLEIIKSTSSNISDTFLEMKIMLTLRKQRLNEEFEALGDLFDIDKVTAQKYYAESQDLVSNLFHSMASTKTYPLCDEGQANQSLTDSFLVHHFKEEDGNSFESDIKYKGQVEKDSDFNSDDCNESDTECSDSDLEVHKSERKKKRKQDLVRCPICRRSVGRLNYHMEANHLNPQQLNKTICGLCFLKFRTHKQLREHQMNIHNGDSCACDVCGRMFQKFSAVKEHILNVHSKLKPFLCDMCGTGYASLAKLKVHKNTTHFQIRNHACNLCNKKYFQDDQLQAHIRSAHTKERPFTCRFDGCNKSFGRSGSRHTHERMHKVKFSCEICSKVFSFRQNLQTHCRNIHGKNVIDTEKCKIEIGQ